MKQVANAALAEDKYLGNKTVMSMASSENTLHNLTYQQVERLIQVVSESIEIFPKEGNFPTLTITPAQLIKAVRKRLDEKIHINDVRLNGSAASYCLADEVDKLPKLLYHDLDIIFSVNLDSDYDLHVIKEEVLNSLLDFFPQETQTERISCYMLEEFYVKKMVKVSTTSDRWSLLSLGDEKGKNIDLKFVHSMKRQYEFSVDSFQIILDPLLSFDEATNEHKSPVKVDADFFPSVQVTSLYGEYTIALNHLNNRLICTKKPEEIRGGGLLKYCYLQVNGYQPANLEVMETHEPYMCCRFFIDFPLANSQYEKIHKYVFTRFIQPGNPVMGLEFLEMLVQVIRKQARCLMESEKHKTINILLHIESLISWHFGNPTFCPVPFFQPINPAVLHPPHWHHHNPHYQPHPPRHTRNSRRGSDSSRISPPPLFPHSANNAVPVGRTPMQVR